MARFILDVANISEDTCNAVMNAIMEEVPIVAKGISTLHCIDKTNSNQFYDDPNRNKLSQSQIDSYNLQLKQDGHPVYS